jgi:hypothetical protein
MKFALAASLLAFLSLGQMALASSTATCRLKSTKPILEDLNQNGHLWKAEKLANGDVHVTVEGGKVWLDLADEEVSDCDNGDQSVCVDYKWEDPETLRVEYEVEIQIDGDNCILKNYQNLVGVRPARF